MKDQPKKSAPQKRTIDPAQYNDPSYNYQKYWEGREYENAAEEIAIKRLIGKHHFDHAADVGGGYGRLCVLLEKYSDKVTLAEASQQQLDLAKGFLQDHPKVERKLMQADDLKFEDGSLDLLIMIRVMHYLPDPSPEFEEISRVLAPDGYAIIEVANYIHARNRIKYLLQGKPLPTEPVDIRSEASKQRGESVFVNHNPRTVIKQLAHAGLKVEQVLSVSNLRSPGLKKIVPRKAMLAVEGILQPALASSYFGPSIFMLVKKA
ncbi:MAG TPA: class I SAM-dependent methyltransferase [Patescibacteria group bacterium]|nr:class I SAM-dependent methyltransferase [Patescibacteria group bacterium]